MCGSSRTTGIRGPLILVQNVGGMKKVTRTRAVLTYNAGRFQASMAANSSAGSMARKCDLYGHGGHLV